LEKFFLRGMSSWAAVPSSLRHQHHHPAFGANPRDPLEHFSIRADAFFTMTKKPNDAILPKATCCRSTAAAGLDFGDYSACLAEPTGERPSPRQTTLFKPTSAEFAALAETQRRIKQKTFLKLPKAELRPKCGKQLRYIREAEQQKFITSPCAR
jgi:hypothetical protein